MKVIAEYSIMTVLLYCIDRSEYTVLPFDSLFEHDITSHNVITFTLTTIVYNLLLFDSNTLISVFSLVEPHATNNIVGTILLPKLKRRLDLLKHAYGIYFMQVDTLRWHN